MEGVVAAVGALEAFLLSVFAVLTICIPIFVYSGENYAFRACSSDQMTEEVDR
jgi:hypothetical protein